MDAGRVADVDGGAHGLGRAGERVGLGAGGAAAAECAGLEDGEDCGGRGRE